MLGESDRTCCGQRWTKDAMATNRTITSHEERLRWRRTHRAPTRCSECQCSVRSRLPPDEGALGDLHGRDPEALDTCQARASGCWSAALNQNQDLSAGSQAGHLGAPELCQSPREWAPFSPTLSLARRAPPPALGSRRFHPSPGNTLSGTNRVSLSRQKRWHRPPAQTSPRPPHHKLAATVPNPDSQDADFSAGLLGAPLAAGVPSLLLCLRHAPSLRAPAGSWDAWRQQPSALWIWPLVTQTKRRPPGIWPVIHQRRRPTGHGSRRSPPSQSLDSNQSHAPSVVIYKEEKGPGRSPES